MGQFTSQFFDPGLTPVQEEAEAFADVLKQMPANEPVTFQDNKYTNPVLNRPTFVPDGNSASLVVQCIHVDERPQSNGQYVLYISGLTKEATTVMLKVEDYEQSFYILAPVTLTSDTAPLQLRAWVEDILRVQGLVTGVQLCVENTTREGNPHQLLKISVPHPEALQICKEAFKARGQATYEADVPYLVSFLRTTGIQADSWIELPAGTYERVAGNGKTSSCQVEVRASYRSLRAPNPQEVAHASLPEHVPRRTLSFDIETTLGPMGPDGKRAFPTPITSSVIQISNIITWQGGSMRVIFTLGECAEIVGAQVLSFSSEELLLNHWFMFVRDIDPDTVTGYNVGKFDLPFVFARAQLYQLDPMSGVGRLQGRALIPKYPPNIANTFVGTHPALPTWSGPRQWKDAPIIPGRVTLDLMINVFQLHLPPGSRYGLAPIAERFLGERKISMDPQNIPSMQDGGPDSRRILAIYCLKDAHLVMLLLEHMRFLRASVARARSVGVPVAWLMKANYRQDLDPYWRLQEATRQGFIIRDL
ncbi:delta DNA polymerase [Coprinopsis sp. MPI-PUGE-AT-0042]|nr:delta DNA polymerase [Coprinopsis sp. MPI-PUGE-AT-0042]